MESRGSSSLPMPASSDAFDECDVFAPMPYIFPTSTSDVGSASAIVTGDSSTNKGKAVDHRERSNTIDSMTLFQVDDYIHSAVYTDPHAEPEQQLVPLAVPLPVDVPVVASPVPLVGPSSLASMSYASSFSLSFGAIRMRNGGYGMDDDAPAMMADVKQKGREVDEVVVPRIKNLELGADIFHPLTDTVSDTPASTSSTNWNWTSSPTDVLQPNLWTSDSLPGGSSMQEDRPRSSVPVTPAARPPLLPPFRYAYTTPSIITEQPQPQPTISLPPILSVLTNSRPPASALPSPTSPSPPTHKLRIHRSLSSVSLRSTKSLSLNLSKGKKKLARVLLRRKDKDDISRGDNSTSDTEDDCETDNEMDADGHKSTVRRRKTRSLPSSPLVLDIRTKKDLKDLSLFTPLPVPPVLKLPPEVTLEVMRGVIWSRIVEHKRLNDGGEGGIWTIERARKERWVGEVCGLKDVVKISRVCKFWYSLLRSGSTLFSSLPLSSPAFLALPPRVLAGISTTYARHFLKTLDVSGHARLSDISLFKILDVKGSLTSLPTITTLNIAGCTSLTQPTLMRLLSSCGGLRKLVLRGLAPGLVDDTLLYVLAKSSGRTLVNLDLTGCRNVTAEGLLVLGKENVNGMLKYLRLRGIGGWDEDICKTFGNTIVRSTLQVLDMSDCEGLTDECVEALVDISADEDELKDDAVAKVKLSTKDAGHSPAVSGSLHEYTRRVTGLRHLALSDNRDLTDCACAYLAHAVPQLEFLELAGIGERMADDGVARLLRTTKKIRRIDLEDSGVGDEVLECLTPPPSSSIASRSRTRASEQNEEDEEDMGLRQPAKELIGLFLEHIILSNTEPSSSSVLSLVRGCPRLKMLEIDSTRISQSVIREYIRSLRKKGVRGAAINAIDCRTVGETFVKELMGKGKGWIRARRGEVSMEGAEVGYVDKHAFNLIAGAIGRGSGGAETKGGSEVTTKDHGEDECDPSRVVFKCFWSWQAIDAYTAADRERREKEGETASGFSGLGYQFRRRLVPGGGTVSRRRRGMGGVIGRESDDDGERGCVVM